ncbi:unnamed protein product [Ilex paraguariensis]|uniref:F-box protein n=1 Tax=Ilex paraguariensis TaxID=185542 RepID=A0ABC8UUC5_9AQUA
MFSCSSTTTVTADMAGNATAITDVHPDIIRTHILTRLDGPSLASTSSASSHLQSLSSEDELWRECSPLRVDLLDYKETVPTLVKFSGDEETCRADLEEHMSLSWILIDPTHKRAVNLSSLRPVSVQRHWLTGGFLARARRRVAGERGEHAGGGLGWDDFERE